MLVFEGEGRDTLFRPIHVPTVELVNVQPNQICFWTVAKRICKRCTEGVTYRDQTPALLVVK